MNKLLEALSIFVNKSKTNNYFMIGLNLYRILKQVINFVKNTRFIGPGLMSKNKFKSKIQ